MDGPGQTIPGPGSKDGEFRGFIVVVYAPAGGMKNLGLIAKDIVMFLDATTIKPFEERIVLLKMPYIIYG
jgi:hypothetical protein